MLTGKVAVVTGGNRGIGKAVVDQFVKNGAIVYALSRNRIEMESIAVDLNKLDKGKVIPVIFDVRENQKINQLFSQINKKCGKIDILVNNAGIMQDALLGMISEQMIKELFEINVFATIQMTQMAARLMKKKKSGSIINIASIIGINGNAGQSVYSATKGAVISFTKSVAKELAESCIRVNAIAPGIIRTQLIEDIPEDILKKRIEGIKMGRMGETGEVASVVLFLATEASSYITGQVIGVDGGTII
jgi:3-oxoacyl-[acyl-carrier protein] reductase